MYIPKASPLLPPGEAEDKIATPVAKIIEHPIPWKKLNKIRKLAEGEIVARKEEIV